MKVPTLPFRPPKSPRQIFPKYRVVGQGDTLYHPVKISTAGELPFSSNRRRPAYPDGMYMVLYFTYTTES